MNLKEELEQKKQYFENELDKYMPGESSYPEILFKSMRYSLFAGGKRLRPIMRIEACEAFGGDAQKVAETGVDDTMWDMIVAFVGSIIFTTFITIKGKLSK